MGICGDYLNGLHDLLRVGKGKLLSYLNSLVDVLGPGPLAVLLHTSHLVQFLSKMVSDLHPWQVLPIQLDRVRIPDLACSTAEINTFGL